MAFTPLCKAFLEGTIVYPMLNEAKRDTYNFLATAAKEGVLDAYRGFRPLCFDIRHRRITIPIVRIKWHKWSRTQTISL